MVPRWLRRLSVDAGSGAITKQYSGALRRHDQKAFYPLGASVQPGQLHGVILHDRELVDAG